MSWVIEHRGRAWYNATRAEVIATPGEPATFWGADKDADNAALVSIGITAPDGGTQVVSYHYLPMLGELAERYPSRAEAVLAIEAAHAAFLLGG